jgi:alpha-L-rhamnosidase
VKDETSTLGEQLYSRNDNFHHPFGAYIGSWFYTYLAGIRPDPLIPGSKQFIIDPASNTGLAWAKATYKSIRGDVTTSWKQEKGKYTLNVDIPANTQATVYLPATDIKRISENGKPLLNNNDLGTIKTENGKTLVDIGSGSYSFTIKQ